MTTAAGARAQRSCEQLLVTTNMVGAALWAVDMEIERRKALGLPIRTDDTAGGAHVAGGVQAGSRGGGSAAPPRPTAPSAADVAVVVHPVAAPPGTVASPGQPLDGGGVPVATEVGRDQPPPYYQ